METIQIACSQSLCLCFFFLLRFFSPFTFTAALLRVHLPDCLPWMKFIKCKNIIMFNFINRYSARPCFSSAIYINTLAHCEHHHHHYCHGMHCHFCDSNQCLMSIGNSRSIIYMCLSTWCSSSSCDKCHTYSSGKFAINVAAGRQTVRQASRQIKHIQYNVWCLVSKRQYTVQ